MNPYKLRESLNLIEAHTAITREDFESLFFKTKERISKAQALKNMDSSIAKYERELERAEHPLEGIDKKVYEIAAKHLITVQERGGLETRHSDSEDFIEVSVWGLEAALKEAYEAGRKSK